MQELTFEPEIFEGDELEWDLPPGCKEDDLPVEARGEVEKCWSKSADTAILCKKGSGITCPAIPKLWTSHTIQGVPFTYLPSMKAVAGFPKRFAVHTWANANYAVKLTPAAWLATHGWITTMRVAGLEIKRIYTAGAGPYCRCVKKGNGCSTDNPKWEDACTGKSPSNHGRGEALDIVGVKWADAARLGSSLQATVIHSWQDWAEQRPLLVRINAALRTAFPHVMDYSNPDHRDHFHCDLNEGNPTPVWTFSEEQLFIIECLVRLGYLTSGSPVSWPRARDALKAFAARRNVTLPADQSDKLAWRPIVTQLFDCVAIGGPALCRP